jgi:dolichol-phosphate mannosyltransferase
MKISLVIPVYNEHEIIPELYKRIIVSLKKDFKNWQYEVIIIDDGSSDSTFDEIRKIRRKNKKVKALRFSRNFGHHIAITAGLDFATGDFVVLMDGDLQDKPEEIIKLYKKLKQGYDVVYAERVNKKFSPLKKITSNIFNKLIQILVKEKIVINSTIFRIMTKQVAENVRQYREAHRYLVGIIGTAGFKHASQKVEHGKRFKGETKYTPAKQVELALNAIFSFSGYPINFAFGIGIFLIIIAVAIISQALFLGVDNSPLLFGVKVIISSIFIVGGLQIIFLGLIGEYVSRTYAESKKRPLYIIKDKYI